MSLITKFPPTNIGNRVQLHIDTDFNFTDSSLICMVKMNVFASDNFYASASFVVLPFTIISLRSCCLRFALYLII
jgi:hypothetical protein